MTPPDDSLSVLFTTSWYPTPKDSVLGNFVRRHAEAVATGHIVWLLYVTSENKNTPSEGFSFEVKNGVHTVICYYSKKGFSLLNRWRAFKKGLRFIQQNHPKSFDIVHHNVFWPDAWQALYLQRKWKIPYIVSEHWTGFDTAERGIPSQRVLRMARLAAKKAAFICPVTENLAQSMKNLGLGMNEPSKYRVVTNVVDTDFFVPLSKHENPTFHFLHLSNLLDPHKNVSGILRVWKKITEEQENITLTIAGDGPLEDHRLYARELGIPQESIRFLGTIPSEKVLQNMQNSDALILFSNYENFPCVISEAFSSGIPVVSSDVGGIREHLTDDFGFLIPKRDEEALFNALNKFIHQKNRFNPEKLRGYAVQEFSVNSIQKKFSNLYKEAISKKRD
jgi:glycosyltransferase involved in cell wall biosynthesis